MSVVYSKNRRTRLFVIFMSPCTNISHAELIGSSVCVICLNFKACKGKFAPIALVCVTSYLTATLIKNVQLMRQDNNEMIWISNMRQ